MLKKINKVCDCVDLHTFAVLVLLKVWHLLKLKWLYLLQFVPNVSPTSKGIKAPHHQCLLKVMNDIKNMDPRMTLELCAYPTLQSLSWGSWATFYSFSFIGLTATTQNYLWIITDQWHRDCVLQMVCTCAVHVCIAQHLGTLLVLQNQVAYIYMYTCTTSLLLVLSHVLHLVTSSNSWKENLPKLLLEKQVILLPIYHLKFTVRPLLLLVFIIQINNN